MLFNTIIKWKCIILKVPKYLLYMFERSKKAPMWHSEVKRAKAFVCLL